MKLSKEKKKKKVATFGNKKYVVPSFGGKARCCDELPAVGREVWFRAVALIILHPSFFEVYFVTVVISSIEKNLAHYIHPSSSGLQYIHTYIYNMYTVCVPRPAVPSLVFYWSKSGRQLWQRETHTEDETTYGDKKKKEKKKTVRRWERKTRQCLP